MTTVTYKDGIIASDSQSDWFYNEIGVKKIFRVQGMVIGCAGSAAIGSQFVEWMSGKGNKPVIVDDDAFSAIVIKKGKCCQYDKGLVPLYSEPYAAIGSGAKFAIAAMDCGKSAKDAVKIARRRDSYTGGHIHTIKC